MKSLRRLGLGLALSLLALGSLVGQAKTVELPGTIQGALGGPNWNPESDITRMEDMGGGIWEFVASFPKGSYTYKVSIDGAWSENYGLDGEAGGKDIPLDIKADNTIVKFVFDHGKKTIFDSVRDPDKVKAPATVPPKKAKIVVPVVLPAFLDGPNKVRFQLAKPALPAELEGKLAFSLDGAPIKISSVRGAGKPWADPAASSGMISLPGTFAKALGGKEWAPDDKTTLMYEVGPDLYEFVAKLPKGRYEYKVAQGGNWNNNWGAEGKSGGDNIVLSVPANDSIVKFTFNLKDKIILDSINNAGKLGAPASVPPRPAIVEKAPEGPLSYLQFEAILGAEMGRDDIAKPMKLLAPGQEYAVFAREVLNGNHYYYGGGDLGSRWSKEGTSFKVWSPVSSLVELLLFSAEAGEAERVLPMSKGEAGVWSARVEGDLAGKFYQYRFANYGKLRTAADIFCFSASQDGKRSQVVNLAATNPAGWEEQPMPAQAKTTDAIIYEIHTRDFTVSPASGLPEKLRGTYLGLAQRGSLAAKTKKPSGLDYLVGLGVTDIHLLPIQMFNPANRNAYNWGYETTLFNAPDSRYSSNKADPTQSIRDVKAMVQGVHQAGIRLIMDVVYNHSVPAKGDDSAFDVAVPYYYFRTDDSGKYLNESGVGNALHDERPMVRGYIRESLVYWLKEYKVDGYRFDLVGMFTPETVADLTKAVRAVRPDALLYGEPWTGGGPTRFGKGDQAGMSFAVFNDNYRNALRGNLDGVLPGYVMGNTEETYALRRGLAGSITYSDEMKDFAQEPDETINYISAHDNMALWDKVAKTMPEASAAVKAKVVKLAGAMVLLAQGIPFLEGGVEMGRTKQGNPNSYSAGDAINQFEWEKLSKHQGVSDYYAGLIALRRAHPAFRLHSAKEIRESMNFVEDLPAGLIAYRLNGAAAGDSWKKILVVFNGNPKASSILLPEGSWNLALNGDKAGTKALKTKLKGKQKIEAFSAFVFYQ